MATFITPGTKESAARDTVANSVENLTPVILAECEQIFVRPAQR